MEDPVLVIARCLIDNPSWDNLLPGRYGREVARAYVETDKVMRDRGWMVDGGPPLPECVGILLDQVESLMKSQEHLRVELLKYETGGK